MRATSPLFAATLALTPLLAGCSNGGGLAGLTAVTLHEPASPPLARAVAPEAALAALPREAGAVVSVVETRRTDGVDQKITLVGDPASRGDNEIDVSARRRSRDRTIERIDEAMIRDEMAERLPGIAMTITPRVVVSGSGPVGVATGRSGSLACLYAWSNGADTSRAGITARALGIDGPESDELRVRVRLCRQGASEESLVALAEGLRLRPGAGGIAASSAPGARALGGDALETAGYGGSAAALPAAVPAVVAETVVPAHPSRTPPPRLAAPAKPATAPATAAASAPSAPPIAAVPIPLPSGG